MCGTVLWSLYRAYPYFLDADDALDAFQSKYVSEKYSPKHFVKWRRKNEDCLGACSRRVRGDNRCVLRAGNALSYFAAMMSGTFRPKPPTSKP